MKNKSFSLSNNFHVLLKLLFSEVFPRKLKNMKSLRKEKFFFQPNLIKHNDTLSIVLIKRNKEKKDLLEFMACKYLLTLLQKRERFYGISHLYGKKRRD